MARNHLFFQNYVCLPFYLWKCDFNPLEWAWVTSLRRDFLHRRVPPASAIYFWSVETPPFWRQYLKCCKRDCVWLQPPDMIQCISYNVVQMYLWNYTMLLSPSFNSVYKSIQCCKKLYIIQHYRLIGRISACVLRAVVLKLTPSLTAPLSLYCPFIDCPLSLYCPFINCPLSLYCPFINCPLSLYCPFTNWPLSLYCPFTNCPLSLYCPFINCPVSLLPLY